MTNLQIGEQIWTIENLDITTYRNGDPIPNVEDAEEWAKLKTGAWCYFENIIDNNRVYGKLYNYFAICDPRGLAPEGYRIPQHYDWLMLKMLGGGFKSKGDWNDFSLFEKSNGFNAKPGGYRNSNGNFCQKQKAIGWWASTETDVKNQGNIAYWLYINESHLHWKPFPENEGFYVRCIKETYKTVLFLIDDNLKLPYKSISIKYSASTTFQEVLNMIYKNCLKGTINSFSYGIDWTIKIYDGERIDNLDKSGNIDNSVFEKILNSLFYKSYRLIISRI